MTDGWRAPTRSVGLKFLLVCLLVLLMAIPTMVVWGVLQDRLSRFNSVRAELAGHVGGMQSVLGPVLLIPYAKQVLRDDRVETITGEAAAFAETGDADAKLEMDVRKRDIYSVPIYRAQARLTARFDSASLAQALAAMDPGARYDLAKARLVIGVSNTVGHLEGVSLETAPGAAPRPFKPISVAGFTGAEAMPAGVVVPYDQGGYASSRYSLAAVPVGDLIVPGAPLEVAATLKLSGAERFAVAPFAKDTTANIAANWADPSFEGGFTPTSRDITATAFTAAWSVPLLARGVAEVAPDVGVVSQVAGKDLAVRFVEPTNAYTGVNRALKYSLMFIGLVFLTYFMFEIVSGLRAHPAQYIMVGLSQAIFYLLLLAFSEQLGFDIAFLLAAGMTVAMISLYVLTVFKKRVYVWPALAAFAGLYGLMYVLMQLEDYALIVGALTSFAALALLMYLTRNIDWYAHTDRPFPPPRETA